MLVDRLEVEVRIRHELDESLVLRVIHNHVYLLIAQKGQFDGLLEQPVPPLVLNHCSSAFVLDSLNWKFAFAHI